MHRFVIGIFPLFAIFAMWACQPTQVIQEQEPDERNIPENLWLSDNFQTQIDSIGRYYDAANQKLAEGDTLGAEIYFNSALDLFTGLSEEDLETLASWPKYDSLFSSLSVKYDEIFALPKWDLEAEEIREDITELEESTFPDSVLFGKSTVIDTTGPIPITINDKVRLAIQYFQTKGRPVFTRWLERSSRYGEMVKRQLREKEVPDDLFYLAMIESGFNPKAYSYARAVGMWQFISSTGRAYGLRHDWWFDERRDVLKSTAAAAEHLTDLYERFGDWYLAMAGYNCNPRKVDRDIMRYNSRDFWKLLRLPRQTRNYVPTFLAATIIAKNPKKFGFYLEPVEPLRVDTVRISESVDLNVVAKLVDTTFAYVKEINPAVLRWVTPPGVKDFTLYLPEGTKDRFKAGYAQIPDNEKRSWVRHRIRSGEALSLIARKYHTSVSVIKDINNLKSDRIRAGSYLIIPVPQNKAYYSYQPAVTSGSSSRTRAKQEKITSVPGHKKVNYRVKKGDTLGEIAENFETRASKIRYWNGLRYGQYIYPNQDLVIWVPENFSEIKAKVEKTVELAADLEDYHIVRRGDTLWDIAKKYGLSIEDLKKLNKMRSSVIRPGDRLKIRVN